MPQIFKIYQIVIDRDLSDLINREGWKCHVKAVAHIEAMMKGDPTIGLMHDCYTHVADVVADDLNHVFEVGNIGPEERITRHDQCHSISVGDIIESENGDQRWVVAKRGFEQIVDNKVAA